MRPSCVAVETGAASAFAIAWNERDEENRRGETMAKVNAIVKKSRRKGLPDPLFFFVGWFIVMIRGYTIAGKTSWFASSRVH
jgi:hypothetical protein